MISLFNPASPDAQVAPLLKAQEDTIKKNTPELPILASSTPKESPTKLFNDYLVTKNPILKQQASKALDSLQMFQQKATDFVSNFGDNLIKNTQTYHRPSDNILEVPKLDTHNISAINFSENDIPTVHTTNGKILPLDKVSLNIEPQPLSSLSYTHEIGKKDGKPITEDVPVTDPNKLRQAAQIKAIGDSINPDYTNYLLKTGVNEGNLNPTQRNYNFNDGTASTSLSDASKHGGVASVDRGLFQINSKAFPQITDAMADNPEFATLWAISLIDAGKQSKWVSNSKSKDMKVHYE